MKFELTQQYMNDLVKLIDHQDNSALEELLSPLHPADIAEILDEAALEQAQYIYRLLDSEKASDVLVELDADVKNKFLASLTNSEIADQVEHMETDDATDFIQDLSPERQGEILSNIDDIELSEDIAKLLNYEEDTAGALMATEFICAQTDWTIGDALMNLREQAEEIDHVYTIYTIDEHKRLKGTLSLKTFLYSDNDTKIEAVHNPDFISVKATANDSEVIKLMDKYDLVVLPVVNEIGILIGRITIDDVVDAMREDAERDMQLATGVSEKIESKDSPWVITRARIPWLFIGMVGGVLGALVIGNFEGQLGKFPELAFFIPLIAAMGGNVGVQSSALIVQGLANNTLMNDKTASKILKELVVALINGAILSVILFLYTLAIGSGLNLCLTVSISLFSVIILSGIMGTFVPLILNRYKIDPALATGPFITTLNDVLGLLLYFYIGYLFY